MGSTGNWLKMLNQQLDIIAGTWQKLNSDARRIREAVFIQEQNIAEQDEWDELDAISMHFVMYIDQQPCATARLLTDHRIGRVAVLNTYRGRGLGQKLMNAMIDQARLQGRPHLMLSSQMHAVGFYQALGFQIQGEPYMDCDIPHIEMYLSL